MKGLIFDFDGLILETEMPDYLVWQDIYKDHGVELPIDLWGSIIGGNSASKFDPYDYLEEQLGRDVDRDAIWVDRRTRIKEALDGLPPLPGVVDYLDTAKELGLKLAVASSSPECWVGGHLKCLDLYEYFDVIKTADDVENTKPSPELFLAAAEGLGLEPKDCIVFEDSPNGVIAGKAAGAFVVAVPNAITKMLKIEGADLVLDSLAEMRLKELLEKTK